MWYHGTPDVRALRDAGRFEHRTEVRRLIIDADGLAAARDHANETGISALESMKRMKAFDAFYENVSIAVPVFLSARRDTAASYAQDHRAMDYQNAEPAVLIVETTSSADITINAGGETFRGLSWARIAAGISNAGYDADAVKDTLATRLNKDVSGRIRVSDLGAALWLSGATIVDVVNVVDTHTGVGKPDTVRMVFDPALINIPAFDRGPEP